MNNWIFDSEHKTEQSSLVLNDPIIQSDSFQTILSRHIITDDYVSTILHLCKSREWINSCNIEVDRTMNLLHEIKAYIITAVRNETANFIICTYRWNSYPVIKQYETGI